MRQFANIRLALGATVLSGALGLAGGCSDTTNTDGFDDANAEDEDGFDPGRGSTSGSSDRRARWSIAHRGPRRSDRANAP